MSEAKELLEHPELVDNALKKVSILHTKVERLLDEVEAELDRIHAKSVGEDNKTPKPKKRFDALAKILKMFEADAKLDEDGGGGE